MFHSKSKFALRLSLIVLIIGVFASSALAAGDGYYWNWVKSTSYTATCNLSGDSITLWDVWNAPPQGAKLVEEQTLNGASLGTFSATVPGGHHGGNVALGRSFSASSYPYTHIHVDELYVQAGPFSYLTSRSTITLTCYGPGNAVVSITNTDY